MPAPRNDRPPSHLSPDVKRWFSTVTTEYILEAHHVRLLLLAAEAWDRCVQARERLAADGLTIEGREGGMRPHPCVAIERDARIAFASLVKQLGLDDVEAPQRGRGNPGLGGLGITYEQLHGLPEPAPPGRRKRRRGM
jgi:P27 family predicted phage terminase small subunit